MALTDKQREQLRNRITKPSLTKHFKIVLYGAPSTWKTVSATSLSPSNLMIMTETGDSVLTKLEHREQYDNTERLPFTSINAVQGVVEMMREGSLPHTHLILDNMSGVQDKKLSENLSDPKVQKLQRAHPDLTVLQDYQIIAHQMRPMVVDLLELDKDVTIICHARPADPEHNEFQARPDLTKAIFNLVNEKADVVAYFYKDRAGKGLVQTISDDRFVAKARIIPEAKMTVSEFIDQINKWRTNSL